MSFPTRLIIATLVASTLFVVDVRAQGRVPPPIDVVAPAPPRPPSPPDALPRFAGVVRLYLVDEFGDVDGVLAADGTQVRFPPHMGPDLVRTLKPGDRFVAAGDGVAGRGVRAFSLGRPDATPLIEARPSAATPAPQPRAIRAAALSRMQADGVVATVLYSPRGDIDGVVLEDGVIVRLPPRNAALDLALLPVGAHVSVRGYGTRNAYGTAVRAEAVGIDGGAPVALQPAGPEAPRPAPPAPPPIR